MNVKSHILFFVFGILPMVFLFQFSHASSDKEKPSIQWLSFEQLSDSMRVRPKKIFVDIIADWCAPCKMMDKKTFTNKYVVELMNTHYYAVKLDAERLDTIVFNNKPYGWQIVKDGRGAHALAIELGWEAGNLSFPTVVILNADYSFAYRYPAFLTAALMEEVLNSYK